MSSEFDASEFVDSDFQSAHQGGYAAAAGQQAATASSRAPTREEVESKVTEMQHKLTELKQAQQELERERTALEEMRRRQAEFSTGREEMFQHLMRGIGLLEEAEFSARRDAEQMSQSLSELREALEKIQGIHDEAWSKESLQVELTRALTTVENARMEWNKARLKFPILTGETNPEPQSESTAGGTLEELIRQNNYAALCRLGLALTWPIALAGLAIFLVLLLR